MNLMPDPKRAAWAVVVGLSLVGVALSGCAPRVQVPAPVAPHTPEPIPPAVTLAPAPRTGRALVQHLADSAIAAPIWRTARWGILIVDPANGDTLYAHDADKLFMPASNQKLLTSAIALQVLGPTYRWRTPVLLRGVQRGSTWQGDLVVLGQGDPSISDVLHPQGTLAAFDPIADALTARGITRITGHVRTEGDAFAGVTTGFGWPIDDLDEAYSAPIDELLLNEGELRVLVRGAAQVGQPAQITTSPTTRYPQTHAAVVTRAATDTGARLALAYDSVGAVLHITGTIAVGDSAVLRTSYRHPNDAFAAGVTELLRRRGLRIDETPVQETRPVASRQLRRGASGRAAHVAVERAKVAPTPVPMDTLLTLESPTLLELLPVLQKPSQNQVAELFFRTAGRVGSGNGSADSARAVAARTLASLGLRAEQTAYRDGSGLSRHDYLTPRAVIQVLDAMHRAPWGAAYRQALPLAGVDGTIANRMKNTPAARNVNAKTGTLDKARSLSGYVTTADGRVLLFSMLCNNYTVPNREVERVQDLLASTLAGQRFDRSLSGR